MPEIVYSSGHTALIVAPQRRCARIERERIHYKEGGEEEGGEEEGREEEGGEEEGGEEEGGEEEGGEEEGWEEMRNL